MGMKPDMKRGVSLYSYQQTRFLKEIDLEGEIREVGTNLHGADGIEIVDEMSLRYPDPGDDFVRDWFEWMERYGTTPVTMDVSMDVLQFRDHVMSFDECAERLRHDIRLAKRLGFRNVRVLSTTPIEVIELALPLAESLDIRLGKEIHQPMPLEGRHVAEIIGLAERTRSAHLGIVPDFGIFGTRPSEVQLAQLQRRGATPEACEAAVELSQLLNAGEAPFAPVDTRTAGNLRGAFNRYVADATCEPALESAFAGVMRFARERVSDPRPLDYAVVAEALMLSRTSADTLRELTPYVINVHAKFNHMSPVPGDETRFHDLAIDYPSAIRALRNGGYQGYLNSEYEGQRYWQDLPRDQLMDEVEQVRRHQQMLRELTA
jgi:sugar phosphate isomerase/epimerase